MPSEQRVAERDNIEKIEDRIVAIWTGEVIYAEGDYVIEVFGHASFKLTPIGSKGKRYTVIPTRVITRIDFAVADGNK